MDFEVLLHGTGEIKKWKVNVPKPDVLPPEVVWYIDYLSRLPHPPSSIAMSASGLPCWKEIYPQDHHEYIQAIADFQNWKMWWLRILWGYGPVPNYPVDNRLITYLEHAELTSYFYRLIEATIHWISREENAELCQKHQPLLFFSDLLKNFPSCPLEKSVCLWFILEKTFYKYNLAQKGLRGYVEDDLYPGPPPSKRKLLEMRPNARKFYDPVASNEKTRKKVDKIDSHEKAHYWWTERFDTALYDVARCIAIDCEDGVFNETFYTPVDNCFKARDAAYFRYWEHGAPSYLYPDSDSPTWKIHEPGRGKNHPKPRGFL
jgi:hypothetical protein